MKSKYMKIVVLDGYTTNPGDLSWDGLKQLGDCDIYDRTFPEEVYDRCKNAGLILTNKTILNRELFEKLPEIKYVGLLSTGYNVVDVEAASDYNVIVTNVPAYGTDSVAQTVFAHILNLSQHVCEHALTVSRGKWASSPDFTYQEFPLIELAGKTIGIIGLGRIGQKVAEIAAGFGMKVLFYSVPDPEFIPEKAKPCSLDDLFRLSDIISLNCPLSPETKHIVNSDKLKKMKKEAFLINTSRGPLIDEKALLKALNTGIIAGAGLDVLETEPPSADNPLYKAENCYITPHYSWATKDSRARLIDMVVENIRSYIDGELRNRVNIF